MARATRLEIIEAVMAALDAGGTLESVRGRVKLFSDPLDAKDVRAAFERQVREFPALLVGYAGGESEGGQTLNYEATRDVNVFVGTRSAADVATSQKAAIALMDAVEGLLAGNDLDLNMSPLEYRSDYAVLVTDQVSIYGMVFQTETLA